MLAQFKSVLSRLSNIQILQTHQVPWSKINELSENFNQQNYQFENQSKIMSNNNEEHVP